MSEGSPCAPVMVRAASHADTRFIAMLERQCFADPWAPSSFPQLVGAPHVSFLVAERADGELVGYVITWFVVDEAEIANLAVSPDARGSGIGGRLLDAVLNTAVTLGVRDVFLDVRDSNVAARALYASRGFTVVGRRRTYYRRPVEDALTLRRQLDVRTDE